MKKFFTDHWGKVVIVIVIAAAIYYFKVVKPKQDAKKEAGKTKGKIEKAPGEDADVSVENVDYGGNDSVSSTNTTDGGFDLGGSTDPESSLGDPIATSNSLIKTSSPTGLTPIIAKPSRTMSASIL